MTAVVNYRSKRLSTLLYYALELPRVKVMFVPARKRGGGERHDMARDGGGNPPSYLSLYQHGRAVEP